MPEGFSDLLTRNVSDLGHVLPLVLVAFGFMAGIVYELVAPPEKRKHTAFVCAIFLVLALWANQAELRAALGLELRAGQSGATASLFSGMMVSDPFSSYFNLVLLTGTLITLVLARVACELDPRSRGEFCLLVMATCLGGMLFGSATHLLMLYVGLETLSIVSYALAGFQRHNRKSAEAGMKYALYGALASGLMLFGMSYLYGMTGTLSVPDLAKKLAEMTGALKPAVAVVLCLVGCGFLYKIAAVPFHFWSPDVYEGAPTTATAFFSVVPKVAGFAALARVLVALRSSPGSAALEPHHIELALAVVAILTMTLGNLAALAQTNAKRMLAYSSIAHAGYMLAALTVLDGPGGPAALLFYALAYLVMNLGAFLVLIALENQTKSCDLEALKGAVRREPLLGVALVVFLFSLVGMPPLAGFTAKYLVMLQLAERSQWLMIVAIGVNSVISLFYYMRLAKAVAMDAPDREAEPVAHPDRALVLFRFLAVAHVVGLVVLFACFEPVVGICRYAVECLTR